MTESDSVACTSGEPANEERCDRCGESGLDRRTLWMSCFYQMNELGLPFAQKLLFEVDPSTLVQEKPPTTIDGPGGAKITIANGTLRSQGELSPRGFYLLRVCKRCRGDWLAAIKTWFKTKPAAEESCGSGIFVRRNGATVEITEEEWRRDNPGREPHRLKTTLERNLAVYDEIPVPKKMT